jgi:hypothetical protein
MSFLPVSRHDHRVRARLNRAAYLQTFGQPPSPVALDEPVHLIDSANRWHAAQAMKIEIAHGEDAYTHLSPVRPSADLLWLAARLRFAAARGDSARVEVPAALLARRARAGAGERPGRRSDMDRRNRRPPGRKCPLAGIPGRHLRDRGSATGKGRALVIHPGVEGRMPGRFQRARSSARLVRHGAKLHRGRAGHIDVWDGRAHGAEPVVQRGPVPHSALGDPVRAGSGDKQASPLAGRADRPVRVFRSGHQQPLGRSHDR